MLKIARNERIIKERRLDCPYNGLECRYSEPR